MNNKGSIALISTLAALGLLRKPKQSGSRSLKLIEATVEELDVYDRIININSSDRATISLNDLFREVANIGRSYQHDTRLKIVFTIDSYTYSHIMRTDPRIWREFWESLFSKYNEKINIMFSRSHWGNRQLNRSSYLSALQHMNMEFPQNRRRYKRYLKSLVIIGYPLKTAQIENIKNLVGEETIELRLENCGIGYLPNFHSKFKPLIINLKNNHITDLSPIKNNSSDLSLLNVTENPITTLPSWVGNIKNLYVLRTRNIIYPSSISKIPIYEKIFMIENPLETEVFYSIFNWSQLKNMNILFKGNNPSTSNLYKFIMPAKLFKMQNLQKLSLNQAYNSPFNINVVIPNTQSRLSKPAKSISLSGINLSGRFDRLFSNFKTITHGWSASFFDFSKIKTPIINTTTKVARFNLKNSEYNRVDLQSYFNLIYSMIELKTLSFKGILYYDRPDTAREINIQSIDLSKLSKLENISLESIKTMEIKNLNELRNLKSIRLMSVSSKLYYRMGKRERMNPDIPSIKIGDLDNLKNLSTLQIKDSKIEQMPKLSPFINDIAISINNSIIGNFNNIIDYPLVGYFTFTTKTVFLNPLTEEQKLTLISNSRMSPHIKSDLLKLSYQAQRRAPMISNIRNR